MKRQILMALLLTAVSMGCGPKSYTCWNSPGPIQVIGTSNELWCFVEIDRMVGAGRSPGDVPPAYPIGHIQEVVVIKERGPVSRHRIPQNERNQDGHTFHPANSDIFRSNGDFYIYSGESQGFRRTLFKWNGKRFERVSEKDNEATLSRLFPSPKLVDVEKQGKQHSASDGWTVMYREREIADESFVWNNKKVRISLRRESDRFLVGIEIDDFDTVVLDYSDARFEVDDAGFKNLSREEYGYRKQ